MTASIVTPGTELGNEGDFELGDGVIADGGIIRAIHLGHVIKEDGCINVIAQRKPLVPEIGDTVICAITRLNEKNGEAKLLNIEGKSGSIDAEHLIAQFHVTNITDRYLHQTRDALRIRDVCRGLITESSPVLRVEFRSEASLGVLSTICGACGSEMAIDIDGDWNVRCTSCESQDYRALSNQFGRGWGDSIDNIDEINRKGKRWSEQTEKLRNKGPAARSTRIAADIRNDGREIELFSFEGTSGGRNKRNANPDCRLFVGGIPRDIDTNGLREIFAEFGDMEDCIVMTDPGGNSRGFGFVTYEHKDMANAAIEAMATKKVKGKKLGVKLADDGKKRGKQKPEPQVKFYVGNLPFSIDEETLTTLFKDHADVKRVDIATNGDGTSKGFAFISTNKDTDSAKVIEALNGTEVGGRTIRVDLAGQSKGKSKKSSREMRALREEEQDSKKKKPRRKK